MAPPETARLILRELRMSDTADLLAVFSDPYAQRFYPEMTSEAAAAEWVERNLKRYRQAGFGLWAMIDRASGALIGDCGPTWQDAGGQRVLEIGYHVAPAWRGRGLALEAARAAMAYGFATTEEPEIGSIVAPDNVASASVARRLHGDVRRYVNARGLDRFFFFTRRDQRAPDS
ncbi:GNAT family N-acetyltransferase [Aminobacter sp. HY435]|uniref:GNAT family N-acetyltransferase n=1 Tax=Aminobacter sp. HY435 TaxID=2970917 RepID=UPI0022B9C632|nr:GNAT family N-acetyltransferase [Aminobacter sp. HY435]